MRNTFNLRQGHAICPWYLPPGPVAVAQAIVRIGPKNIIGPPHWQVRPQWLGLLNSMFRGPPIRPAGHVTMMPRASALPGHDQVSLGC